MRPYEHIRAEQDCPRCGAVAGDRCRTQDQWNFQRQNHPERNRAFTQRKLDEFRAASREEDAK